MFDNFSASQMVVGEMVKNHLQELREEARVSRAVRAAAAARPQLWQRLLGRIGGYMISVGCKLQEQARPLTYSNSQARPSSRQII